MNIITTYFTKKELETLFDEKREFIYKNVKREEISEDNNALNGDGDTLIEDISILKEKKTEKDFILYLDDVFNNNKKMVILENKEVLNTNAVKNCLIRYYIIGKNKKNVFKIEIKKSEMSKDVENNFYLPEQINDFADENEITNCLNIHRIKNDFKFLNDNDIGINVKCVNAEKYFKENFE